MPLKTLPAGLPGIFSTFHSRLFAQFAASFVFISVHLRRSAAKILNPAMPRPRHLQESSPGRPHPSPVAPVQLASAGND